MRNLPQRYVQEDRGFVTPCHIWQGAYNHMGYGLLQFQGKLTGAHRHFYESVFGPIPSNVELDHLCRVRACVNAAHLELVSHAENVQRGTNAKLTPNKVRAMRALYEQGRLNQRELALLFNVQRGQVGKIVRREQWHNV